MKRVRNTGNGDPNPPVSDRYIRSSTRSTNLPAGYEAELARDRAKVTRREESKIERDSRMPDISEHDGTSSPAADMEAFVAESLHRVFPDTNTNHMPIGDWKIAPASRAGTLPSNLPEGEYTVLLISASPIAVLMQYSLAHTA